jgi:site-specific DNA-cytosine methylase
MHRLDAESETLLPVGIFQDSEFGVAQYDSAGTLRAGRIPEHQMVMQPIAIQDVTPREKAQYDSAGTLRAGRTGETRGQDPVVAVAHVDVTPTMLAGAANGGAGHGARNGDSKDELIVPVKVSTHRMVSFGTKWNGNASATNGSLFAAQAMAVRRLTPVECERLQGFPDNYTAIPWRKKPASECPDGPRYNALGNSWAVPVVRWIGERIARSLG